MDSWFPKSVFGPDYLNNCLFLEMITRVSDDFLTRNDKFGSYFGMEGRFPLLNQTFYKYCMNISGDIKMKEAPGTRPWGEHKYMARYGLRNVLPDYIINKKKTGWSIPKTNSSYGKGEDHTKFRNRIFKGANATVDKSLDEYIIWPGQKEARNGDRRAYASAFFKSWANQNKVTTTGEYEVSTEAPK